jgi:hypothetical protein
MNQQDSVHRSSTELEKSTELTRHPITLENSPEETLRRLRSLPERTAKFKESLRVLREANSR